MPHNLDSVIDSLENKLSEVIENDKTYDQMDKLKHLMETDKELYEYMVVKSSLDAATRRMMANEVIIALRRSSSVIKALYTDNEKLHDEIDYLKSRIDKQEKGVMVKLVYFMFFILIMLWMMSIIRPDALDNALCVLKELFSLIK